MIKIISFENKLNKDRVPELDLNITIDTIKTYPYEKLEILLEDYREYARKLRKEQNPESFRASIIVADIASHLLDLDIADANKK